TRMLHTRPPVPAGLFKAIQHHLRTAQEHEKRDPVVAYYCKSAANAEANVDSKSPECRKFLVKLMDQLETVLKSTTSDNDSINQEVVGNAHIENYALKMFLYADNEDRSFYTSSLLFDVLSVLENCLRRKYARWKATYIHTCLKNGDTPQPGPMGLDEDQDQDGGGLGPGPSPGIGFTPGPSGPPSANYNNIQIPPGAHAPANTPAELPPPTGAVQLSPEDFTKAQKYCKYAGSALQYEDVSTAVQNLQKALKLLTTGKE
uniref:Vesicle (multivesicular body) trafficking 1 n=1 Tax=Sphaeramia orbicularis TaxID=375764 RepID=A0A673BI86_9TELE